MKPHIAPHASVESVSQRDLEKVNMLARISEIHASVCDQVHDITTLNANIVYIGSRYHMFGWFATLLQQGKISREVYISACNMTNGGILDTYPELRDSAW